MSQTTRDALSHNLNIHGFGFQYAVLDAARACFEKKISPWAFEVAEFPISINGKTAHIDFVLRNVKEPFFLVAECKRSDPSLSNWCFVKAPYVSRNLTGNRERIVREVISGTENSKVYTDLEWIDRTSDTYRIPFEMKTGKKGDGVYGRGHLNDSVTQVLRGQNGLIEFFANEFIKHNRFPVDYYPQAVSKIAFFPVIFTTAKLWVSDVVLTKADIATGDIENHLVNIEQKKWLIYQYGQSPDLKHSRETTQKYDSLYSSLYHLFTRSVAVVSAEGVEDFLSSRHWGEPEDWQQ